ncbi:MAG: GNAT family N-acetyltransferase [archaeon]|nr:GNAT family N-acetyltransferase [archaeon]
MVLESIQVTKGSEEEKLCGEVYDASFPRGKKEPFACLCGMAYAGKADLVGYRDGETFVGMSFCYGHGDATYLMYLAVREDLRGNGCGEAILEIIKDRYEGPIVLRVEAPAVDARLLSTPYRRMGWFVENGFVDSDRKVIYLGTNYELLCRGECPDNTTVQNTFKTFQRSCMRVSKL